MQEHKKKVRKTTRTAMEHSDNPCVQAHLQNAAAKEDPAEMAEYMATIQKSDEDRIKNPEEEILSQL